MTIASVVDRWPDSARIFARYTLGCASCAISKSETIAQAAAGHGAGRVKLDDLIGELNVFADTGKLPEGAPPAPSLASAGRPTSWRAGSSPPCAPGSSTPTPRVPGSPT